MHQIEHPHHSRIVLYRTKAREAEEHAARIQDELIRSSWERMARAYWELAEGLECGAGVN